mmetsp:Transcript_30121/g.56766  ORF Transcript_30121/g.56766 Transcript_30121/m.56766 type:complete len:441 (+) Transcript_30121:150-1472(+)
MISELVEEAESSVDTVFPDTTMTSHLIVRGSTPLPCPSDQMHGTKWLSRADSQVALLGLICFCCPGMYNSIISLAGGIDTRVASTSTAMLYALFTLTSLVSPAVCNNLGPRSTLFLGSLGYLLYVVALLHYRSQQIGWIVIVAGGCNGVGAGLFWTAQGQMMMAYPPDDSKGTYTALFWAIFNSGAVAGGAVTFGVNFDISTEQAAPSATTFVVFFLVMLVGSILCLALVCPEDVVRSDGRRVLVEASPHWSSEVGEMVQLLKQPQVILLIPFFAYSNWFYTYEFGPFNSGIFDARTQGFCNMFFWGSQMVGALAIGLFLDSGKTKSVRERALKSILLVAVIGAITWTAALKCWSYWVMAQMADSPAALSRYAGVYKAVQSAGAAAAWSLNGFGMLPSIQAYINIGLMSISIPLAVVVVVRLMNTDVMDRRSKSGLVALD